MVVGCVLMIEWQGVFLLVMFSFSPAGQPLHKRNISFHKSSIVATDFQSLPQVISGSQQLPQVISGSQQFSHVISGSQQFSQVISGPQHVISGSQYVISGFE